MKVAKITKKQAILLAAATASISSGIGAQLVTSGLITRLESDNVVLSGSNVTSWTDLTGVGGNASGGAAPAYQLNATPSGMPVLDFNGTSQYLDIEDNAVFDGSKRSWYVVFKADANNAGRMINGGYRDVDPGAPTLANYATWGSFPNSGGTGRVRTQARNNFGTFAVAEGTNGSTNLTDFFIAGAVWDSTTPTLDGNLMGILVNQANVRSTYVNTGTLANAVPTGHDFTRIGAGAAISSTTASAFFDGKLAAVLVYDRVLSASEQTSVEQYLYGRYLAAPTVGSDALWDAGAGNGNLGTAANWAGDTLPTTMGSSRSRLVFGASAQTSLNNDISGAGFGGMRFTSSASAYTMGGNPFSLLAGSSSVIVNESANTQTFNVPTITLSNNAIDAAKGDIVVNSALALASGANTFRGSRTVTANGVVSGSGTIVKTGSGTLVLANSGNSFTGSVTATDGVIAANSTGALGGAGTFFASSGASTGRYELNGNITTTGTLSFGMRNGGTTSFSPQLVTTGSVTIGGQFNSTSGGTISAVRVDSGTLTLAGPVRLVAGTDNPGSLYLDGAGQGFITSALGNAGTGTGEFSVVKLGTGTWTIVGTGTTASNDGNTTVLQGTLKVTGAPIYSAAPSLADDTPPTTITVGADGTLDLTAIPAYDLQISQTLRGKGLVNVNGTLTAYEDNIIRPGNDLAPETGVLTVDGNFRISNSFVAPVVTGTTNFGSNSNLHFRVPSTPAGSSDKLAVTGNLEFNTSTGAIQFNITPEAGLFNPGTYQLITYGSKSGSASYAVNLPGGNANYRAVPTLDDSQPGHIDLVVPTGMTKDLIWKGDGAANEWDVRNASNFNNGADQFYHGDRVILDDSSANTTVTITAGLFPGEVVVSASQDYTLISSATLNASTGVGTYNGILGSAKLLKTGSGNLTMLNIPPVGSAGTVALEGYTGSWEIQNGTITYAYVGILPGNALDRTILNGGALKYVGASNGNTFRLFSMGPNGGTLDGSGTVAMSLSGTNPLNMLGTGDRTLTLTGTSTVANVLGWQIADPAGGKTSLVKNGSTTWNLNNSSSSFTGGITVNAGTLNAARLPGGNLALNGGWVNITSKAAANDPSGTSVVTGFSSTGGLDTPGGTLDITNNSLIIDYTGASNGHDLRRLVNSGGVVSSSITGNLKIGFADNTDLNLTEFGGRNVDSSSILAKLTVSGDANLDSVVNSTDFNALLANYGGAGIWGDGDFNYDGKVNTIDFNELAGNFGALASAPLAGAVAAGDLGSVVPEPSTGAILGGIALLAARRRRG